MNVEKISGDPESIAKALNRIVAQGYDIGSLVYVGTGSPSVIVTPGGDYLLLENGRYILLEDGSKILMEG